MQAVDNAISYLRGKFPKLLSKKDGTPVLKTSTEGGSTTANVFIMIAILGITITVLVYLAGWIKAKFFKKTYRKKPVKKKQNIFRRIGSAVKRGTGKGSQAMKNKMARLRRMRKKKKK